uniref:WASH complex subunit 3 n=1 Tax=Fibrocapsa japonica TaxID=94617 RepID=A0A7S2XZF2_9STRA|mmetsp:Transcript_24315/g.35369  ORF Transcript_24315/g.35369 Transcript_24315/m.35369 type:complete len:222 (+) Transcript_24315:48-713(+)
MDQLAVIDLKSIKPIQPQKTVLLLNNFIANTTRFLNTFARTCENKLCTISTRITELEVLLSILECKLNSIPGLEDSAHMNVPIESKPDPAEIEQPAQEEPQQSLSQQQQAPPQLQPDAEQPSPPAAEDERTLQVPPPGMVLAREHPEYAQFFTMLRVGVPEPQVRMKLSLMGVDAAFLSNPDLLVPLDQPEEENEAGDAESQGDQGSASGASADSAGAESF